MQQIVINVRHGGFGLSQQAMLKYVELSGKSFEQHEYGQIQHGYDLARNDPTLVEVVEQLGQAANGPYAKLKVVTIPDDVEWTIMEYDGWEWVAEAHRTWN